MAFVCAGSTISAQKPTLVTIQHGGVSGGGGEDPVASANGRFVAFHSTGFTLSPIDNNGRRDVFVRDLETGTTTLVSVNLAGTASGNGDSQKPTISADGRYVAFESTANNLVANDNNSTSSDIFVRDLQTGTTTLLSVNSSGTGSGNQESLGAVISANGRLVAFRSFASNLVANDNNNTIDVFARDLQTGTTSLVSRNNTNGGSGNGASFTTNLPKDKAPRALISKDGRFVVFESYATDLVSLSDANGPTTDAFVHDLQTHTTSLLSINNLGTASGNAGGGEPVIAGNGRYVFFQSSSTDLAGNVSGFSVDLFVRDLQSNTTTLVSVTTTGTGSDAHPQSRYFPVASDDGRYVIFQSEDKDFVTNDSNNQRDVFFRDLQTNTTTLISGNSTGGTSANSSALGAVMSADGRFVSFIGFGNDYVSMSDTNNRGDVYLRDVVAGTTTALSINSAGTATANLGGDYPLINADGRFVYFESGATDMVANPITGTNIFAVAINGRVQIDAAALSVNENAGNASFTVTRAGSSSDSLTVQYATRNGTATAGADYAVTTGSLTFADGEISKPIVVPILDDPTDEPDETLTLTLSDFNASGAAAGSLSSTILTITDDDPPPSISVNDIEVTEGNSGVTLATFTLTLSQVSGKTVSVNLSTVPGGTASSGVDYNSGSVLVNVSPGNLSQAVSIGVIGETTFEDDETFLVSLSNPTNVTISDGSGMATIKNDDPVPTITIFDVTKDEGNGGTSDFVFTVRLSNRSSRLITFQFTTANGTAQAGSDYVMNSGTIDFQPGGLTTFVIVSVNGDSLVETNETFVVNLSNPTEATLADSQAVGTIRNDDLPVLSTEDASGSAVALDALTRLRDPFPLTRPYNFGPDLRTRVSLYAMNLDLLPGDNAGAVTATAEDEFGTVVPLTVEYAGFVPDPNWLSQIIVRLPDSVGAAHTLGIRITFQGSTSNKAVIRIASP